MAVRQHGIDHCVKQADIFRVAVERGDHQSGRGGCAGHDKRRVPVNDHQVLPKRHGLGVAVKKRLHIGLQIHGQPLEHQLPWTVGIGQLVNDAHVVACSERLPVGADALLEQRAVGVRPIDRAAVRNGDALPRGQAAQQVKQRVLRVKQVFQTDAGLQRYLEHAAQRIRCRQVVRLVRHGQPQAQGVFQLARALPLERRVRLIQHCAHRAAFVLRRTGQRPCRDRLRIR